ncbi:hypothetical protein LY76DRAFT_594127 [Colletotrichum caudatum]|nr:hypothetical protein LY76DRAFT_594127 [Colletotrichum caudatum]
MVSRDMRVGEQINRTDFSLSLQRVRLICQCAAEMARVSNAKKACLVEHAPVR